MKIKSRKDREKEYSEKYGHVSNDIYERVKNHLGKKFNEKLLIEAKERIKYIRKKVEYHTIHMVFYEKPIQTHRPRVNYKTKIMHVPNAKANHNAISKFIHDLKDDINIISTPMKITLKAYYAMPSNIKPVELLLYELEHDYAIGKPDFDNVLKSYCDMIQKILILDDDLVSAAEFVKYFSLKPRVELFITYTNGYASKYAYKTIHARKSYMELSDYIEDELLCDESRKKVKK